MLGTTLFEAEKGGSQTLREKADWERATILRNKGRCCFQRNFFESLFRFFSEGLETMLFGLQKAWFPTTLRPRHYFRYFSRPLA